MKLLLDTHIWIWNLGGSERLPARFKKIIADKKTELSLSPISVWETLMLAGKGRLDLKPNPTGWVREALKRWPLKEAPLNCAIAIKSHELDLPHPDPADRFIAATALIHGLQLMTLDDRLRSAAWLPTVK
jgi:PIN domain nuclease of toxin-antitoxin system